MRGRLVKITSRPPQPTISLRFIPQSVEPIIDGLWFRVLRGYPRLQRRLAGAPYLPLLLRARWGTNVVFWQNPPMNPKPNRQINRACLCAQRISLSLLCFGIGSPHPLDAAFLLLPKISGRLGDSLFRLPSGWKTLLHALYGVVFRLFEDHHLDGEVVGVDEERPRFSQGALSMIAARLPRVALLFHPSIPPEVWDPSPPV